MLRKMNYDDWKLMSPPEIKDKECLYCGEPTDDKFCSKECEIAFKWENDIDYILSIK